MEGELLTQLDDLHTRVDGGMTLEDADLVVVSDAEAVVRSGDASNDLRAKFIKVTLDTANQLSRLNMLAGALSTYSLLAPHFTDAGVLFNMGMVHIKLGDLSEAYECFVRATREVDPVPSKYWKALAALGMVQMQQEEFSAAAKSFNSASFCSNHKSAIVLYNAGLCEIKLGDKLAAHTHLTNALALEPGMVAAQEALQTVKTAVAEGEGGWEEHAGGSAWQAVLTADGSTYYYNHLTGETSWVNPEAEVAGGVPPHAAAEGGAAAAAEGGAAAVAEEWTQMTTAEGGVYFFNSTTQESSWEPPAGFGGASAGSTGAAEWEEKFADSGHAYYVSHVTGESVWERPASMDAAAAVASHTAATPAATAASPSGSGLRGSADAASEWVELAAEDGTPYYFNRSMQATSWTLPKEVRRSSVTQRKSTAQRRGSLSDYSKSAPPPHRDMFAHHEEDDFSVVSYEAIVRMKREELPPDFDPNCKERCGRARSLVPIARQLQSRPRTRTFRTRSDRPLSFPRAHLPSSSPLRPTAHSVGT